MSKFLTVENCSKRKLSEMQLHAIIYTESKLAFGHQYHLDFNWKLVNIECHHAHQINYNVYLYMSEINFLSIGFILFLFVISCSWIFLRHNNVNDQTAQSIIRMRSNWNLLPYHLNRWLQTGNLGFIDIVAIFPGDVNYFSSNLLDTTENPIWLIKWNLN